MALVGNLRDLKLVNIIQINCIEHNTAKLTVITPDKNGSIYFSKGNIVHGEYGHFVGERSIYEMLALQDGQFKVEAGIESPAQTITHSWNSLVMEGLRLVDERQTVSSSIPKKLFSNLSSLKNVENVLVFDFNGNIIEGKKSESVHLLFLTLIWYKHRKLLNYFHSDSFHYIQIRKTDRFFFIFELPPNLILVETNLRLFVPNFLPKVRKILNQLNLI